MAHTYKNRLAVVFTLLFLLLFSSVQAYAEIDLQVSSYTVTPDPVINGGAVTFSITVENNLETAAPSILTITPPDNVTYVSDDSGCGYSNLPVPTVTCDIPELGLGTSVTISYTATGNAAGVESTTATITEDIGDTDSNPANNSLSKNITSINGADLTVTQTGPGGCAVGCTATAGSTISFTLTATNNGPDPATMFQVVDDLPATADFTYLSAVGDDWSCLHSGITLTCDYSGTPIGEDLSALPIIVTGRVITSDGSISNSVEIISTDPATGEPDETNNVPAPLVVTITPGTDLRANKTMLSDATGLTSFVTGETGTLTLSATNTGTQGADGVELTDSVPADFALGVLPGACSASGQDITCTVGLLSAGATSVSFLIPLTVTGSAGASGTNTVNITRTSPTGGTDTSETVSYSIVEPFARLTISKSKAALNDVSPGVNDPVQTGAEILNTVVVTNSSSSTSAATGTVTVRETLNIDSYETFGLLTSASETAGWVCIDGGLTVNCTFDIDAHIGTLARGAALPNLVFTTTAVGANMDLSNQVCTGGDISAHLPPDSDMTPECSVASIYSADPDADIGITKAVSDANIDDTEMDFTYTIEVTNHSGDTAPTIVVTDDIPMYYYGSPIHKTSITPSLSEVGLGESCSVTNGTVNCTIKNLTQGQTKTITILVARPVLDGTNITNTASWDSLDTVDSSGNANNSASIDVTIAPIADVAVLEISSAPDPVKVGVELAYITSIDNNGPSAAKEVVLRHTIDTSKVSYVAGSAALTAIGSSCSFVASFDGAPLAELAGIECTGFDLANDESRQLTFSVVPTFNYWNTALPGESTYASSAAIRTNTTESDSGNNSDSNTANITQDQLDISVTKQEARGYDPDGTGSNLLHDPVAFGDKIKYLVTVRNNGPSLATEVVVTDILTPPSGWKASYDDVDDPAEWIAGYVPTGGISCSVPNSAVAGTYTDPQVLTCYLGSNIDDSILPAGEYVTLQLTFVTGGDEPPGSITYSNTATIESAETGPGDEPDPYAGDTLVGNNTINETTTVLPKTDLYVIKETTIGDDGSNSSYNINETFEYRLTIGNKGPTAAAGVLVTDALPANLTPVGTVSVSQGTNVSLTTPSCAGTEWTGSCNLGPLPVDSTGVHPDYQVEILIPVRAVHPYVVGDIDTDLENTASIIPIDGTSIDTIADNNTDSATVQIRDNSISGQVYADNNQDNFIDAGEGISGVTLTLSASVGTDIYGNVFSAITTLTTSDGSFTFDRLPPGTYTIAETQPGGYWDRFETIGDANGTKPADTCDGVTNCSADASSNTISGIELTDLTASTDAIGYIFQELERAQLSGYVYHDADNNGDRGSESGVPSLSDHTTLSGTAYNGVDVQMLITETLSPNASSGQYSYTNLPPSDGTGYTLQQNSQPVGYFDGKDQAGDGIGNVISGSENRQPLSVSETITSILLDPDQVKTEHNFGELLPSTLSGFVFIDMDADAVKDAGETVGVPGVTITLSGTDYLGNAIPAATTDITDSNGAYSFSGLLPGTYALAETPPAGLDHTGAEAGVNGGDGAGAGSVTITNIVVLSGETASGYNFGESGEGLSGFVYIDSNNNGIKDTGETGISGVSLTVSGNALAGGSVCGYIASCTVTTDGSGLYSFANLPASDASGYTLTEQSQTNLPLSGYADGLDAVGSGLSIPGTAADDVISGIGIVLGEFGVNYNFAEQVGSLSGTVYFDTNDNGFKDTSEAGIDGISVTLSGYTWGANGTDESGAGDDVAITESTTATTSGGDYSFTGLLRGTYTITETHPDDWGDGRETAGSAGGTAANTGFNNTPANNWISDILLPAGSNATAYLFGEISSGLSGRVCEDVSDDGLCQAGEAGIAGIEIALSGTTTDGGTDICTFILPASCTTATVADGSYSFPHLPAGTYTLTETHPVIYLDGREYFGNPAGTVDNSVFDNSVARNSIVNIPLLGGQNGSLYDFGEQPLANATISGHVWLDSNHDRIRDAGETVYEGWTVQLWQSGSLSQSTTTGANGLYSMSVVPNTGYELRFIHPNAEVIFGSAVPNETASVYTDNIVSAENPAGGDSSSGILTSMTIISGATIPEHSLPLDPSGVVYDAITRNPVAGAIVSISGPATFNPAVHLLGGTVNARQATGDDGLYQFLLLGGAPDGPYHLEITPPPAYVPTSSVLIPVCDEVPAVGNLPNPALVQTSADPPLITAALHDPTSCPVNSAGFAASGNSTQYYSSFNLTVGTSADVVNNHIPVDPVLGGAITLVKTSPLVNVTIGQLVPYSIRASNNLAADLSNIDIRDTLPPGFKFKSGSASIDDLPVVPTVNGRVLSWADLNIPANGTRTLKLLLVVGAGVQPGEYINTVQAFNNLVPPPDNAVSNRATAVVRVIPDPVFDCSDVIGKVFDDQNANGYQDDGEPGIPSVRVATARGLLVTTDAEGRYHVTCAMVPNEFRGSNFIMKLDERTLPSGYRITTENPRTIHLTRGKMGKLNFGAAIHRVVRLEMTDAAFIADQNELGQELSLAIDTLPEQLRSAPSIVRLAYNQQNETNKLIRVRLKEVGKRIEELWEEQGCCYTLVFEEEIFQRNLQSKGGDK